MTSTIIAARANSDRAASPNMDLQIMLRGEVVPALLMDAGYPSWSRVVFTGQVLADEYLLTLPDSFREVRAAYMAGTDGTFSECGRLKYVGDREDDVVAFQTIEPGIPTEYYFQTGLAAVSILGGSPGYTMVLNCPLSADRNVKVIGYSGSITGDDYTNEVEFDNYIPRHIQPVLIVGLRRLIYKERYGTGDRRFQLEDAEYNRWLVRITESREATTSERAVFVR